MNRIIVPVDASFKVCVVSRGSGCATYTGSTLWLISLRSGCLQWGLGVFSVVWVSSVGSGCLQCGMSVFSVV